MRRQGTISLPHYGFAGQCNGAILHGEVKTPSGNTGATRYLSLCTDFEAEPMSTTIMSAVEHGHMLVAALEQLRQTLDMRRSELRVDAAFGVDLRNKAKVDPKAVIEIAELEGQAAIDAVIKGLTAIELDPEQNAKETLRVPGAVGLPSDLIALVESTNELRKRLHFEMQALGGEMARRNVWRRFPSISGIQTLRLTQILVRPTRISFFWATGSSVKRYQVAALREELVQQLPDPTDTATRYDVTGVPQNSLEMALKTALNLLAPLPAEEHVAIQRPVRPHIRARIDFIDADGQEAISKSTLAPVPFVYDVDTPPPTVQPLTNYQGIVERNFQFSHAKLERKPFIKSLNLYQYLKKPLVEQQTDQGQAITTRLAQERKKGIDPDANNRK